jgi:MFS family permease
MAELYASSAIADIAMAVVMLFEPIFLYNVLKFTIPEVLLFMGAVYAFYIILIPLGAKVASRFGYEHSIYISIPFQIIYWVLLFASQQNLTLLYFAPLAFALQKTFYWPAFHASIARFANNGQTGREFSLMHQIINLSFVLGPYLGGLISERFGVRITFIIASSVYFFSFIPLFTSKEVFMHKRKVDNLMHQTKLSACLAIIGESCDTRMKCWPIKSFLQSKS